VTDPFAKELFGHGDFLGANILFAATRKPLEFRVRIPVRGPALTASPYPSGLPAIYFGAMEKMEKFQKTFINLEQSGSCVQVRNLRRRFCRLPANSCGGSGTTPNSADKGPTNAETPEASLSCQGQTQEPNRVRRYVTSQTITNRRTISLRLRWRSRAPLLDLDLDRALDLFA
jgi:hypothetical protein